MSAYGGQGNVVIFATIVIRTRCSISIFRQIDDNEERRRRSEKKRKIKFVGYNSDNSLGGGSGALVKRAKHPF